MADPCPACHEPRHPALDKAGLRLHPCCEIPPRPVPAERPRLRVVPPLPPEPRPVPGGSCDFAPYGCGARDVAAYAHGVYDLRHARMMAPRVTWAKLGIPEPEAG